MKTPIYPGWWQVLAALIIQGVSAAAVFTAYSVAVAPLKLEFEPSNMVLMLGITVTSLASGLLSPAIGTALDRFSIRKLMWVGVLLVTTGFLLLSMVTGIVQVVVIYGVFMAISSVLLGPIACSALLARWFIHRRGFAIGIAASGTAIGGLLLPPLLQGLIEAYEWRFALRLFAGLIFLITAPVVALLVIDRPPEPAAPPADAAAEPAAPISQPAAAVETPADTRYGVLRDLNFWLVALTIGTIFAGPMGLTTNMVQFMAEKGVDAGRAALLLSAFSAAGFAGKMLCAAVSDRINVRLGLSLTLALLALGMFGLVLAEQYQWLLLACLVVGMASGTTSPFWSVILAAMYGPARLGKTMGLMTLVIMPFTLLAPPLFGLVSDVTGSYINALLGHIVLAVLALLSLTRLRMPATRR